MSNNIEIKQPPLMYRETQALIEKIESKIGMPMIVYWNSFNGAVCQNDVQAFYNLFKEVGNLDKVAIFIKSDGGDTVAALRIVNVIRNYAKNVTALIPLEAASSATLITLGSDEIHMGPLAYLTPIDSSKRHQLSPIDPVTNGKVSVSQDEIQRIEKLWHENAPQGAVHHYQELYKYVHPIILGSLDRSSSLSIRVAKNILSYHNHDEMECERISKKLNSEYPAHSFPIMSREAKELGLNVQELDAEVHDLLLELNSLYSEMGNKAFTDFDEFNYHDNQILNILEAKDLQLYYQNDKDWSYIKDERRWQVLNDNSYWYKNTFDAENDIKKEIVYIS
ncbi:hypothetical protein G7062_01575 [Erysipelothrix sp. HDW6C]|uniref:SDH family Clp fold serine proteinase n=1 Tax=Erysipelothrix sp. HDW6C TaxID=2714930 RepID=UPI001407AEB7|nr:hypothetical protein [Erysipelothrix sp. HDW6C]QIK69050.1 hypothetical protein G7062_01575 [Erysipelothrix sp. HDW6C]